MTALSPADGASLPGAAPPRRGGRRRAPWHDQTLPIAERMKLAEGSPLRRRMMAAMAQQDCGQCGYLCDTYAEAIASGAEKRLNLCAPGGKETARMLKKLAEELAAAARRGRRPRLVTPLRLLPSRPERAAIRAMRRCRRCSCPAAG